MEKAKPKKSLVNLSLDSELVEVLKAKAKELEYEKMSDYVQDWFKKLALWQTDIKRVILHIPDSAMASRQSLEAWMRVKSVEVVDHYFEDKNAE